MLNYRMVFNLASRDNPGADPDLILAIRSDAPHASKTLSTNIKEHLRSGGAQIDTSKSDTLDEAVDELVHPVYTKWLNDVVEIMAHYLDSDKYKLGPKEDTIIEASYYSAETLEEYAVENAEDLVSQSSQIPPVFISLDDMIGGQSDNWSEIAFSREFTLQGDSHNGYVGRPTKDPIEEQLDKLAVRLKELKDENGGRNVPIVLMEDNVRKAKMLNWVIGLMDDHGIFDHSDLKGISTCFCCADEQEKQTIQHNGQAVPVVAVLDFAGKNTDVITPRDLLLDGYVVMVEDEKCRLPAVFMDVANLMKIEPGQSLEFKKAVIERNIEFCKELQDELGFDVPLEWFIGSRAISHVMDIPESTTMLEAMEQLHGQIIEQIEEQTLQAGEEPAPEDAPIRQRAQRRPPQG